MAEEKNLWKQLKNNTKSVIWTRIEATSGLGIPDLFEVNFIVDKFDRQKSDNLELLGFPRNYINWAQFAPYQKSI